LLKKNKPIPDKNIEPEHNDRIKTLENEAAAVSCEYKLSDFDVQELIFDKYVDKFPDTHYVDLTKLLRVKVGSNPQNYLIYSTEEEVTDTIKFKKRKIHKEEDWIPSHCNRRTTVRRLRSTYRLRNWNTKDFI